MRSYNGLLIYPVDQEYETGSKSKARGALWQIAGRILRAEVNKSICDIPTHQRCLVRINTAGARMPPLWRFNP